MITVLVNGDTDIEPDDTFTFFVQEGGFTIGQVLGTIANDDFVLPELSIGDVSVNEGTGGSTNAVFTVTLSAPSDDLVTVQYATASGSATDGVDYTSASGTASITAGATSTTIVVAVNGDNVFEPTETFFVDLTNPTFATIVDPQGLGTILDDEAEPTFSIDGVSVTEGDVGTTNAIFTVTLSGPSSETTTVGFQSF
jgi:hypothetical protein